MATTIEQKISPFLWFESDAEAAAEFYVSVFKDSRITAVTRYGEGAQAGSVMVVVFELCGQKFYALNGGPHFKINEAISFFVGCETQAELDGYWAKLTSGGGAAMECGWLKDRFGVTWQVGPARMDEYYKDPATLARVMKAYMQMVKVDLAALQAAGDGGWGWG